MNTKIVLEHQKIYQWNFFENKNTCLFKFEISDSSIFDQIQINFVPTNFISVTLPNHVPFLCGQLGGNVSAFSFAFKDSFLKVVLQKIEKIPWALPVINLHPKLKQIDPQSATIIALSNPTSPLSPFLLTESLNQGFFPILLYGISQLTGKKEKPMRNELLRRAVEQTRNPKRKLQFAHELIRHPETCEDGLLVLCQLGLEGNLEAAITAGLVLSPLSDFQCPVKDPYKSFELLEECLNINYSEPVALLELSKMLKSGIGCEKNSKLSRQYLKLSKKRK